NWLISSKIIKQNNHDFKFKGILHQTFNSGGCIRTMDVLNDEKLFVTGGKQFVSIWELDTGRLTITFNHNQRDVSKVKFLDKRGKQLCACDGTIRVSTIKIITNIKHRYGTQRWVLVCTGFKNNSLLHFRLYLQIQIFLQLQLQNLQSSKYIQFFELIV